MPSKSKAKADQPEVMIGLSAVSLVLIVVLVSLLPHLGTVWNIVSGLAMAASTILLFGLFGLLLCLKGKTNQSWLLKLSRATADCLYPIALMVSRLFGLSRDMVQRSYINIRNLVTGSQAVSAGAGRVLVLVPHCLQWSECKVRITSDVSNCRRCGRCAIGDLLEIQDRLGFFLYVASGGTAARRAVKEVRPKAIVGVACERDLVSGMQDVKHIPVLGVTNERPHGPCYNTDVDLEKLERAVMSLMS